MEAHIFYHSFCFLCFSLRYTHTNKWLPEDKEADDMFSGTPYIASRRASDVT